LDAINRLTALAVCFICKTCLLAVWSNNVAFYSNNVPFTHWKQKVK